LFCSIALALLTQWCWIYQVLADPEQAVQSSQNSFFEKILLYTLLGYTFIILNDMISIVIQT